MSNHGQQSAVSQSPFGRSPCPGNGGAANVCHPDCVRERGIVCFAGIKTAREFKGWSSITRKAGEPQCRESRGTVANREEQAGLKTKTLRKVV